MLSTEIQESISSLVGARFPELFIVDMNMTRGKYAVLGIKVEKDGGVTLDECMLVSRAVGEMLEEKDLIKSAYRLEVSSPGVGKPFKVRRQYQANLGRHLSVQTLEGETFKGKLLMVEESTFTLERPEKNKKKKEAVPEIGPVILEFDQVQSAKVIIV